jgi:hypothetical protein
MAMKDFTLASRMLTLRGEFYPTGFMFVMVPTIEDARAIERKLLERHIGGDDVLLLTSQVVLDQIAPTAEHHGDTMPSVGFESNVVRQYRDLARQGHCALMIKAGNADHTEQVMEVVRSVPFSIAEKYRFLVIEDLR